MELSKEAVADIIEWDVVNWSKCLDFFTGSGIVLEGKKALAIGERHGGLSLWLALNGAEVISTDLNGVSEEAKKKHLAYKVEKMISYSEQNILELGYPENTFDIVMFKSVIGALGKKELQQQAISGIRRVLKPGGVLLFAENLVSSPLHGWLRKKFIKWAGYWRYVTHGDVAEFCSEYSQCRTSSAGFLGALGRSESQRKLLGLADNFLEKVIPAKYHYIIFVAATK